LIVPRAAGQDVLAVAAEQKIITAAAKQGDGAGLAEQQIVARTAVSVSFPLPPNRFAAGSAPFASSSAIVSSPAWPNA
jgi:hypothetical protein